MRKPPAEIVAALRCSLCTAPLTATERSLRCVNGHSFDIARQGYVNLLHAKVTASTADTAEMVAARAEFLGAGHYAPLAEAIVRAVTAEGSQKGLVVDAGAGTGYYLARVLDASPAASGLALDLSGLALRRAARAHPRAGAAVWNLWEPLPLADGCAAAVLNVFAPRNGAEYRRVLAPGGILVVVTPTEAHLAELADLTPMLAVDPDKRRRVSDALDEHFEHLRDEEVTWKLALNADEARALIRMGPNAHHLADGALDDIPATVHCTASCLVSVYAPKGGAA